MAGHSHDHNHDHHTVNLKGINTAFYIGIGLNSLFTIIEFIVGYQQQSLALIADASHNLSDVASLIISLIGLKLAQKAATISYTYGYKKASILASLINSVLLIVIVINIAIEGIERLSSPPELTGVAIIITALIGVVINTVSAFLFYKGQKSDINIRGAFLHLVVDALVSVGVVISGIIIYYTGWNLLDPIISFIIAAVISVSGWSLLKESIKLSLDGVPGNVEPKMIESVLKNHPDIKSFHHLHVWALSSFETAMTVHLVVDNAKHSLLAELKKNLKHQLKELNIHHITIEIEDRNDDCEYIDC